MHGASHACLQYIVAIYKDKSVKPNELFQLSSKEEKKGNLLSQIFKVKLTQMIVF